ncbi:MAG: glutamine--tRNA ligase/YqeY domain fusion protein [Polyangiaceae bacterium]|nr:glutamine--tRNA ligase/YqeY domain fusion protein [Polyangiaceae bacterium]
MTSEPQSPARDFIREIIDADLQSGRVRRVITRFPPEPNGYLHIGHAKSICLNFGIAEQYGGECHLRFDDSNPTTEDQEYVEAILRDVRWLGFDVGDRIFYASDYFERLYELAESLVERGHAYVDSSSEEAIRAHRGTVTEAGTPTPHRQRSPEESLALLRRMRAGEFPDGAHVLRARIDLASPNMKMRDPVLYRIRHAHHYRTGDAWCIYPLYDFVHPLSDALESISHSICTLEFENNRELYDWVIEHCDLPARPRQYEFARLNLTYTVMSKRKLLELVAGKHVSGWDDPRMPTLAGLRRRGVTPEALRAFAARIGVSKHNSVVDVALFEHTLREDLNLRSPRVMCVLEPLKITLEDWEPGHEETLDAPYWPADVGKPGSRSLPIDRELYIERSDFSLTPPKGWRRLAPGAAVRLRHAFVIRCERVVTDADGNVSELVCRREPDADADGSKTMGTIHWVSARRGVPLEVRLYDRLFESEAPGADDSDALADLNRESLRRLDAIAEPSLLDAEAGSHWQLERLGFFFVDPVEAEQGRRVLGRVVPLKDSWAKQTEPARPREPGRVKPAAAGRAREPLSEAARALAARHDLSEEDARVLAEQPELQALLQEALTVCQNARSVASWLVNELPARHRGAGAASLPFRGDELGRLVQMLDQSRITAAAAKRALAAMLAGEGTAEEVVRARDLEQTSDEGALGAWVDATLAENADVVARFRAGNENVLGALLGMVMRKAAGKADPQRVRALLGERLRSG